MNDTEDRPASIEEIAEFWQVAVANPLWLMANVVPSLLGTLLAYSRGHLDDGGRAARASLAEALALCTAVGR